MRRGYSSKGVVPEAYSAADGRPSVSGQGVRRAGVALAWIVGVMVGVPLFLAWLWAMSEFYVWLFGSVGVS